LYIALEGIDTCGKSTQLELLKKLYSDAIFIKEPGSTPLGEKLREILLGFDIKSKRAEFLLFCAARAELYEEVVSKNRDKLIISDRSVVSGIGYADSFDYETLISINRFALDGLLPQKIVFLVLKKDTLIERMSKKSEDRIEQRGVDTLLNYQKRMQEVIGLLGIESIIVEADMKIEEIHKKIVDFIEK